MDYDFRNRENNLPFDSPHYGFSRPSSTSSSSQPMYGPSPPSQTDHSPPLPVGQGLRPWVRHPQLSSQISDILHSTFQFDFELERNLLLEAEKDSQNWSRLGLEKLAPRTTESSSLASSHLVSVTDPVVHKYVASGLSREAVPFAIANYGDNPTKVRGFSKGFTQLREMGFSSNNVAEALVMQ